VSPRAAKPNRTDLNVPKQEPITAAPNQEYGDAGAQKDAQRAVPIGTPDPNAPPSDSTPVTAAAVAQRNWPQAGTFKWLHPTDRPDEPVTEGLPFGPGNGPEVLSQAPPLVSDTLETLAASPNASARVAAMAQVAKSLGV
jgi:hypothetical protein